MIAQEILLILNGHTTTTTTTSTTKEETHHSKLLLLLNQLFLKIRSFIQQNQPLLHPLAPAISTELTHYQESLLQLEFRLLSHHPSLVVLTTTKQPPYTPSTPISAIIAELKPWESKLTALSHLIDQIQAAEQLTLNITIPLTQLIEITHRNSISGQPSINQLFIRLQESLELIWINSFKSFLIYSQNSNSHTHLFYPNPPNQTIQFSFHKDAIPVLPSLQPIQPLKQSIQQICHALSIIRLLIHQENHNIILPSALQTKLRQTLSPIQSISHPQFRMTIKQIQDILSNYLFSTYLTPEILSKTLGTITDVFLLQHATFATNLVEGIITLRERRIRPRNRRLTSLTERELDLVLLKAGISIELGEDPNSRQLDLKGFSFGFIQNDGEDAGDDDNKTNEKRRRTSFNHAILSKTQPIQLDYSPKPGLSLLLTKQVCERYSKIHACLLAFLIAQQTCKNAWRELTQKERIRSRLTPVIHRHQKSDTTEDNNNNDNQSVKLERLAFEGLRRINWFINLMVDYFFQDVISHSIQILTKEINEYYLQTCKKSSKEGEQADEWEGEESRSSTDFLAIHHTFLSLVEIGLGMKSEKIYELMQLLLSNCTEFFVELESCQYELVPSLLSTLSPSLHPSDPPLPSATTLQELRFARLSQHIHSFTSCLHVLIQELRTHPSTPSTSLTSALPPQPAPHDTSGSHSNLINPSIFHRACMERLGFKLDFNGWFSL